MILAKGARSAAILNRSSARDGVAEDTAGEKIGKLRDVYVDVETDEPRFATVKEGFIGRHLTFVPLGGIAIGPDAIRVAVTNERIASAPTSSSTERSFPRTISRLSITTTS